jgi:hypothetical protein
MPEPAASDALDAVAQPASELLPEDPWAHLHASKPPAHARLLPMPPREQWLPAGKRGAAPVAALIQGCVRILSGECVCVRLLLLLPCSCCCCCCCFCLCAAAAAVQLLCVMPS